MKIRTRLTVALGSLTLIILIVGMFSVNSLSQLDAQNKIYSSIFAADLKLYQARLAQADYMLTEDDSFARKVNDYVRNANADLNDAKSQMAVDASIEQVEAIQSAMSDFENAFNSLKSLIQDGATAEMREQTISSILTAAQKASAIADRLIEVESEIAEEVRSKISFTIILAIVIAVIISVLLALWLTKAILTPLAQSSEIAEAIACGNLNYRTDIKGNDEFSDLNIKLLRSIDTLKNTIVKIKATLDSLNRVSTEVESAVNSSTESMSQQQAETDQLAAALEQMAASTTQISNNAELAASTSNDAENQAKMGNDVITRSRESMSRLSKAMEQATSVVTKLDEDSKSIASILQVIQGIAEQTNLLALNAAIEAARAGDQGRGFAVVADEVRQLAQRTQASTSEITQIVELIQNGASDAVTEIENSNSQSEEVITLNDEASSAYSNITHAVNEISNTNAQVATGASEQSQVSLEVSRNVNAIKQLADGNTENLFQIRDQAQKQAEETRSLKELIEFFSV